MVLNDTTKVGLANRFTLKIDQGDYDLGSWAKVEGLDVKWDVAEYRAGDAGNHRWYIPGITKYTDVKLTRAACADSLTVKKWLDATAKNFVATSGKITLMDSSSDAAGVMFWDLKNVVPVKWSITGFDAGASKVATETLEIAHLGFLDDEVAS
jgi:phage tail-like protein